jgi:hypothetical protein
MPNILDASEVLKDNVTNSNVLNSNKFDPSNYKANVYSKQNDSYLFTIGNINGKLIPKLYAKVLYDWGYQWFEPLAENYVPLLSVAKNLATNESLLHFSWNNIAQFSLKKRLMAEYATGFSGDWKASSDGARGYFLITVNDYPYWADAVGQIPYAVANFRNQIEEHGNEEQAIFETIETGRTYGDGNLINPERDDSSKYDIFFVLRGALGASKAFNAIKTNKNDYTVTINKSYSPNGLGKQITNKESSKYLAVK